MKVTAKITSKGQITVPRAVRRALGVRTGDHLLFEEDDRGLRLRALRSKSPFAEFQGIGNRTSGRKAILRRIREMRDS